MKKKKNYLDYVPVCAPGYNWKLNEKKQVEIEVQNKGFYNRLAQSKLYQPGRVRQLCMAADGWTADHL